MTGTTKKPYVIGLGEIVFDIMPDSRKLGGAPADFLHYAVKYGADGNLISAIGADDLGREVVSELQKFNINPVLAVTPYPTGRVLIFKSPSGGHTAHILENAAWDYIPATEAAEECIAKAEAVYFGTLALRKAYSKATVLDLIDAAPKDAYKFFDINLRQNYYDKEIISCLLERANILKLNIDELKTLKNLFAMRGSAEDICLRLKQQYHLEYVILSDAAKESKIWGKDNLLTTVKNSRIHQSFAFGAGNAFAGAFITALLSGATQQEAHETANLAAVEVCRSTKG
ncbi:MAG: PfkB family carbohydrate kinase [Acetobacter sp.]|nr:PfkB family carbohydrate kinase [Acetobacter sp.]